MSLTACVTADTDDDDTDVGRDDAALFGTPMTPIQRAGFIKQLRSRFAGRGIAPIPPPVIPGSPERRAALVALGQALVFDKILSDDHDISCMTCHPPSLGTDDDRTLPGGVGGGGLGVTRAGGTVIARNAPPLFNLHGLDSLFWDGRVEKLADGRYRTPAGAQLTPAMTAVFEFGAASAIGLFPVTSREEMRGRVDGRFDDLAAVADGNFTGIWGGLMTRLRAIPRYRELFGDAYPDWPGDRLHRIDTMTFAHASNAMAAYFLDRFTSDDSPWDRFVAGDGRALKLVEQFTALGGSPASEDTVLRGADQFLRTCAMCHDGPFLTDNRFHNTLLVQVGPGLGDGDGHDDYGRERIVAGGDPEARCGMPGDVASCRYAFRTPPLRNVLFTGPYGHGGQIGHFGTAPTFAENVRLAVNDLRTFVFHYSGNPANQLEGYLVDQLDPALRDTVQPTQAAIIANMDPVFRQDGAFHLETGALEPLMAFLVAQTSTSILEQGLTTDSSLRLAACGDIPLAVPSGLPVDGADAAACE